MAHERFSGSVVLHLGSRTESGDFDEEDLHAHGASYPWSFDLMLAPHERSPQRFSIFVVLHVHFLPSFILFLSLHQVQSFSSSVDKYPNHIPFVKVRPQDRHQSSSSTLSMKTAAIFYPGNSSCPSCRMICQGWVCEKKSWSSICSIRRCWFWEEWIPAWWIWLKRKSEFLNVGRWKLVWLIEEESLSKSLIWVCWTFDCLNGFPTEKSVCPNENESC